MALLEIQNLVKKFPVRKGFLSRTQEYVHAVNGVSFSIDQGKTLGVVGESGSGKTTLGRMILKLLPPDSGSIFLEGEDIAPLSGKSLKSLRHKMQMIFQDPYSSLNPRMTIEKILEEGLKIHHLGNASSRQDQMIASLKKVGLSSDAMQKYPHEFSGGQRQRIGIARALILKPKLIVCDEPISALDVSIQAQVLNLLLELKREMGLTYLFISHDLKVVRHMSDEIVVMYLGYVVESMSARDLSQSRHPYTRALLAAVPETIPTKKKRELLTGEIPSPIHLPSGCVFHTRCPHAQEVCKREIPVLRELAPGYQVACHLAEELS